MPDQLRQPCADHDPSTCFCDERRDREAGIHRPSGVANAFGGYVCVCEDTDCPARPPLLVPDPGHQRDPSRDTHLIYDGEDD